MASLLGIVTSDAALVRCELDRLRRLAALEPEAGGAGLGAYQDAVVLQRHSGAGAAASVWEAPSSDIVLLHAAALPVDRSLEDNAQPFRFRQWLFAHVGQVERADAVRARLIEQLPDFLQSVVRGATVSEAIFGQFLTELRATGRTEDPTLEAPTAMRLLMKAGAVPGSLESRQVMLFVMTASLIRPKPLTKTPTGLSVRRVSMVGFCQSSMR